MLSEERTRWTKELFWAFGNHEPLAMYRRIGGRCTGGVEGGALYLEKWHSWYDSEESVRAIAEMGGNILHCRFYKGMGWEYEKKDFPAVRRFAERCRKAGIRVLAYVQYSTLYYEFMEEEIPHLADWAARSSTGAFIPYVSETHYFRWMPCVNSAGFVSYLKGIVSKAAEAGCFDGVMVDNWFAAQCRCGRCLALFREYLEKNCDPAEFGLPNFRHVRFPSEASIASQGELKDPLIIAALEFWAESNHRAMKALYDHAMTLRPDWIFAGNGGSPRTFAFFRERGLHLTFFRDCCNLLVAQTGNEPGIRNGSTVNRIREMMICELFGLPVYPLSDGDAGELSSADERNLLLARLFECRVWHGIAGDRMITTPDRGNMLNPELYERRKRMNTRFRELSEQYGAFLDGSEDARVGVLLSTASLKLSKESNGALLSWEELLMRKHIPFRPVLCGGAAAEGMENCRILIAAGQRCLSDKEVRILKNFPGTLIVDSSTGEYDERHRHRAENPFASPKFLHVEGIDSRQENDLWCQRIVFPSNGETLFQAFREILENGVRIQCDPGIRCRRVRTEDEVVIHFINYTGKALPLPEISGVETEIHWVSEAGNGGSRFSSWCMARWKSGAGTEKKTC